MIRINNTQYFHFLQSADALRRSGLLCDAIISVQSQTFKAHRLVLACASRALAQQLARGDADSPVHCTLDFFLPHTFQQVLDFTYTQALEVPVKDLHLLLKAAKLLEMQPLVDQCRKQLEALEAEKQEQAGESADLKDNRRSVDEEVQKPKESLVYEVQVRDTSTPAEKASVSNVDSPNANDDLRCPKKKARLSPVSEMFYSSDGVITKPTTSSSSFSSPWTFPKNVLDSMTHLNTLRRITQNYSSLVAAHPLQSSNQSSLVYPFSLSTPRMFPLLSSHFQSPFQTSAMGYSRFPPHYTQNLYTGTSRMGSIIKHSLLKRKRLSQTSQTTETRNRTPGFNASNGPSLEIIAQQHESYSEVPEVSERAKNCQHCSTRLLGDPMRRDLASTGKGCAGCQFCGGQVVQHEAETRGDHRGEKPYQCKHCPKKFSLKHQLDTHHRVHTGEKPFECRLCGQRSRDYSAMIKHLRTHGGAAPYQCTVCLEFCSSLVAMQRHVKSHAVQDFPPDWSISRTYLYISHI